MITSIRCTECRDGDHDNFDEDVRKTRLTNPATNRVYKTTMMCADHRDMYEAFSEYSVHLITTNS